MVNEFAAKVRENIKTVIKGKDDVIDDVILCVLCQGHILMEDVPGTGKTTLIKALAKSLGLDFTRVQFTPDLLPSDLTGVHFFDQKSQEFIFRPGPVFTNILLGDEINRATPRTQSSLLECMEERQVSVDGITKKLEAPFIVAATQNPIEIQGTFPLPEAQLDRFFMRLSLGYPDEGSEKEMMTEFTLRNPLDDLESCTTKEDILFVQRETREIHVSEDIKDYILRLVAATRTDDKIRLGVSPRGSLALMRAAQGRAAMEGRGYVLPEDVKAVCVKVLAHRIVCKAANYLQASVSEKAVARILEQTAAPSIGE